MLKRSRKQSFNPRTYIRYDKWTSFSKSKISCFNPRTYIRYDACQRIDAQQLSSFNPRTYIRYDCCSKGRESSCSCFNPRTYIRYDAKERERRSMIVCFNPRTYIRYDCITNNANIYSLLSMHLCDNKLFGFFIDEIKLIGVFNRLIINDCENSSFLLMLNVRKQLYYKFIFYIIGCDDTYVFNSFRIIISQEIETNTIFFMIDDIR